MKQMRINGIPAIQYGDPCENMYLYIHGKNGHKEEAEAFAQVVCPHGFQVLSIDLPEHGSRKAEGRIAVLSQNKGDGFILWFLSISKTAA